MSVCPPVCRSLTPFLKRVLGASIVLSIRPCLTPSSCLPWFLDKFFGSFLVAGEFLHVVFEANCAIRENVERFRMTLEEFDELKDARPDDRFNRQVRVVLSGRRGGLKMINKCHMSLSMVRLWDSDHIGTDSW